jgi:multicomponent Na+:H+ antiporter subunit C
MFEDGAIINELLIERLNYFIYVVLLLIGLHAMISKRNLIKKLIGMSIFQTAIILFYVSIAVKDEATIPIYKAEHDPHGAASKAAALELNSTDEAKPLYAPAELQPEETQQYANPLPHVLMLTAIVVGVATLGLALALCLRIQQGYGTVEEDELLVKIERADARYSQSPLAKATGSQRRPARTSRKPRTAKATRASQKSASSPKSSGATQTKKSALKTKTTQARKKPASATRKPTTSSSKAVNQKPATKKSPVRKPANKTSSPKKKGAE